MILDSLIMSSIVNGTDCYLIVTKAGFSGFDICIQAKEGWLSIQGHQDCEQGPELSKTSNNVIIYIS